METRAKKAHVRESAEVIVVEAPSHEGPNVKVMQIAVSKVGRIWNRRKSEQTET